MFRNVTQLIILSSITWPFIFYSKIYVGILELSFKVNLKIHYSGQRKGQFFWAAKIEYIAATLCLLISYFWIPSCFGQRSALLKEFLIFILLTMLPDF